MEWNAIESISVLSVLSVLDKNNKLDLVWNGDEIMQSNDARNEMQSQRQKTKKKDRLLTHSVLNKNIEVCIQNLVRPLPDLLGRRNIIKFPIPIHVRLSNLI